MRNFTFTTLTSTVLVALRLQGAVADDGVTKVTYAGKAATVNCLPAFNEARAAAGLVPFTEATTSFWTKEDLSQTVCKAIMEESKVENPENFNATVALAIQDGDTGDCAAAVTHFNGALAKFGSLPPAFSTSTEVYKSLQAVSFVALYNPKDNPTLDCAYFSCTQTVNGKATTDGSPAVDVAITKKKGLLCASSPLALIKDEQPFGQEQFDEIKAAINSASTAVPALVPLAMVAAVFVLF